MPNFPQLSLVLGGAASGKSRWAERLVRSSGLRLVYIATAQAMDAEMTAKIAQHQVDRGNNWRTIEAPLDLAGALKGDWKGQIVLVDCLTMWLSNHLISENDIGVEVARLLSELATMAFPVVLVSNEVGNSVVPENALARRFQSAQGRLNQSVAKQADLVVTTIAGLPLALKGQIPEGAF